jgi:hypothetical protein
MQLEPHLSSTNLPTSPTTIEFTSNCSPPNDPIVFQHHQSVRLPMATLVCQHHQSVPLPTLVFQNHQSVSLPTLVFDHLEWPHSSIFDLIIKIFQPPGTLSDPVRLESRALHFGNISIRPFLLYINCTNKLSNFDRLDSMRRLGFIIYVLCLQGRKPIARALNKLAIRPHRQHVTCKNITLIY